MSNVNDPRKGLSALADLNFQHFVTISVIKLVYILGIVLLGIVALGMIITGFTQGIGAGIGALIVAPILFLIWLLFLRIYCELIVVLFRIAQNTSIMAGKGDEFAVPGSPPAGA